MLSIALICLSVVTFYLFVKRRYSHWERKGVPFRQPSFPFGNFREFFVKGASSVIIEDAIYKSLKADGAKHAGTYVLLRPAYVLIDPELIKHVLHLDFQHFAGKPFYVNEKDQPLSAHLFVIGGERWRLLRQKLTPTFTSGKMKMMLGTLTECRKPMKLALEECAKQGSSLDVKELTAKFTTDVIGSVAFGLECNSFKDPDSEFRRYGKEIFELDSYKKIAKTGMMFTFQGLSQFFSLLPITKETADFFERVVKNTIRYRAENKITRNDFMQLLINLMETGSVDGHEDTPNKITLDEIVAQSFVFFIAGFETSSTTVTFCMLELALNQEIQNRVRDEINAILGRHDGEITYEALKEMKYMQQVIDETLRKYPPLPNLDRICTKDYRVPGTDVVIDEGTSVGIPIFSLHRDPEYFPEPELFNPERFSAENISKIRQYTYLPFGEGPRTCIGLRFGIMQTKVALITLLKDFKYSLNERTDPNIEFTASFILTVKGDVFLDIESV